jgi:hypothetical protein
MSGDFCVKGGEMDNLAPYEIETINEPSVLIHIAGKKILLKGELFFADEEMILTKKELFIDNEASLPSLLTLFRKEAYGI